MSNWAYEQLVAGLLKFPKLLLMLDYDGTLVSIADRPELAVPGPDILQILGQLTKKPNFKLAIVSGRELADLKKILPVAGLFLVGCHGAEFQYPNGERGQLLDAEELAPALKQIGQIAEKCVGGKKGYLFESKKYTFALHYRLADRESRTQLMTDFKLAIQPLLNEYNLALLAGKMVLEIHSPVVNKGNIVEFLMGHYNKYYPVYIGDDTTDEDAFKIIQGKGTGVLVACSDQNTAASVRLQEPKDVVQLLQILSARC